jgi:TonB-linked SusC/RagA family outer membrane protein
MRKLLLICLLAVVAAGGAYAQTRTLSGLIKDERGEPMPGASVVLKGTTRGTITDIDGKFSLPVDGKNPIITISGVGYKTTDIEVGNASILNDLAMEPSATALNEVIVTAAGIERSARSTGYSVQSVKTEVLNQAKTISLAAGLSGKVSGLQINQVDNGINGGVRVVLRGNRSLLGNNQALIVLDGVIVPSDYLNSLNPNDVENVTVLKGANAAALYGSQAANGVLIISTKQGTVGKPEVTFSSTVQAEQIAFTPKLQNRFGLYGGESSGDGVFYDVDPNFSSPYVSYENQSYGPEFNGKTVQLGRKLADGTIQTVPYTALPNEKSNFFNKGITLQNDISLSAADKTSSYYIGVQDVNRTSIMPGDQSHKDVIRINGTKTYGIFKIGFGFNYNLTTKDYTSSAGNVYFDVFNTAQFVPLTKYKDWQNDKFSTYSNYFNDFFNNPYYTIYNNRATSTEQPISGKVEMSIQPTKWFNLLARVGLTDNTYRRKTNNNAVIVDPNSNPDRYINASGNSRAATANREEFSKSLVGDLLATFDQNISKDINARLILGGNIQDKSFLRSEVSSTNLLDPSVFNTDYRYGNLAGFTFSNQERRLGAFADLSLGYKNFLFAHGSLRNDWVSLLAADNRSFLYPEADIALVFTDAFPVLKNKIISYGKIAVSVAQVGNVSLDPYQINSTFGASVPFTKGSTDIIGLFQGGSIVANGLKPEFTLSRELNLDMGFFDSRANVKFAYFQTNTTNQTVPVQISRSTGFVSALVNTGEVLNKGYEIDLNATPILNTSGLKWTVGINYTHTITNTPLSIYGTALNELNVLDANKLPTNSWAIVGQEYPSIKTTDWLRDPQGHVIVDAVSGLPSRDPNPKVFGQANPIDRLGLNTSITYAGLTLAVTVEYRGGGYIYNALGQDIEFGGIGYQSAQAGRQRFVFPNSVIAKADGTYVPNTNVTTNNGNYDFWQGLYNTVGGNYVTSSDFWKVREIALNYSLPTAWIQKTGFVKRASIGVNGRNLFIFRPESNQWTDPEFANDNSNATGTTSRNQIPPSRVFGGNLTIIF